MDSFDRQHLVRFGVIGAALALSVVAAAGLLLIGHPRAPLLVTLAGAGAAVGLYLVQKPLTTLYIALFLALLPLGLRVDLLYDIAANLMVALALGSWLLHAAHQPHRIVWTGPCVFFALYILWGVMTLLWAPDLIEGRRTLVAMTIGSILLFLLSNQVRTLRDVDGLMRVLAAIGWLLVVGGLHAVLSGGYEPGTRLQVFGMNENMYGLTLILTLPGVIWPVFRSTGPGRHVRMGLSTLFIVCTLALVAFSGSRGSALSLMAMLLAFWFWKPLRPWGIVGAVLAAGMLVVAPFMLETLIQRFEEEDGGALGGRELLWKACLQLIGDHLWTGVGIGNGPFELRSYFAQLTSEFNHRIDLPAHNPLLEVAADTGLIGMLIYLSIGASALRQFLRSWTHAKPRKPELAIYFPILLGVTIGYFASWIKGGGMWGHISFFVLLAMLTLPSQVARHTEALRRKSGLPADTRW